MPTKRQIPDRTAAKKAKKVVKGKKLVAKGAKIAKKASTKTYAKKRKTQVKGLVKIGTAENMTKAGKAIQKSKGQGVLPKKRKLKVTKKSMHKSTTAGDKYYTGKKRDYKGKK